MSEAETGVPLHQNRYVAGYSVEGYVREMERVFGDERYAGLIVYEHQRIARARPDASGLDPFPDVVDAIRAAATRLGLR